MLLGDSKMSKSNKDRRGGVTVLTSHKYGQLATVAMAKALFRVLCIATIPCLHGSAPGYLQSSIIPVSDTASRRRLRSASSRVANRPEFFGTVPNSAAVSRVPNGSIRDRLMSRIFTVQKVMSTRILISGF